MRKKLQLSLGGLVAGLLVCEVLTRLFVPDPLFRHENRIEMWQPDAAVGYRNKANLRDYAWGYIPVVTNHLGFRGPEVSAEKLPGMYRIVGLGDSVAWGAGIRDEDTYLRVLEREMQSTTPHPSGFRFEGVNTAVVGYSTYQELVTLQRYGLPLCPDMVIIGYVTNDAYPTEDPFFNVNAIHVPPKNDVQRFYYPTQHPYPLRFLSLLRSVAKLYWHRERRDAGVALSPVSEWKKGSFDEQTWPIMQQHFRKVKQLAAQNHFRLLVLLFPSYQQVKFTDGVPFRTANT